ncbi:MAG TPA: nuclear transport factor 2 family protein [Gemmatimonadaceae bacterium]|nr:nuclear transport factor 2 family protein [Gemmatimonadaceae bacterium]
MWHLLIASLLFALAPPALPAQRTAGSAEAEVERVARQYLDARLANDTTAVRRLLAEEYTGINSSGVLGDRASALRLPMNVTPMGQPIAGFEVDSVRVRVYDSAAVMTGIRRVRSADGSGGGGLRFMFVFIRRDGRWQLAASQATDLQSRSRPR